MTANRADTPLTTAETGYAEIKADLNAAEVLKNACEMWRKSKLKQVAWHQRRRVQTAVDIKPHGASKAVRVMAELWAPQPAYTEADVAQLCTGGGGDDGTHGAGGRGARPPVPLTRTPFVCQPRAREPHTRQSRLHLPYTPHSKHTAKGNNAHNHTNVHTN